MGRIPRIDKHIINARRRSGVHKGVGRSTDNLPRFERRFRDFRRIEVARQIDRLRVRDVMRGDIFGDDLERPLSVLVGLVAEVRSDEDIDRIAEALALKLKKVAFNTP